MIIFCVFTVSAILGFHLLLVKFDPIMMILLLNSMSGQVLASLAVGYVVAHLNNLEKQQRAELEKANRQLLQHSLLLEQLTISHERNRLARELHDTLAHTLSSTTVQLEASQALRSKDQAKSQQLVQQSLQRLRSGLTETRRALEALRASPLEDLGFLLALRELILDYQQRTGWLIDLQLPEYISKVSPIIEQTLYRCMQEVLSNIDRHSAATEVEIMINVTGQVIRLFVRDNGRGFNVEEITTMEKRFGIVGMQERVEALGGLLKIDSQVENGTTIDIEMRLIR